MRLTDQAIQEIAADGQKADEIAFDDDLPGFGVRVRRHAGRTTSVMFVFQYRLCSGRPASKQRRMTLGSARAIALEDARAVAAQFRLDIQAYGRDPQGERYGRLLNNSELHDAEAAIATAEKSIINLRRRINARHV